MVWSNSAKQNRAKWFLHSLCKMQMFDSSHRYHSNKRVEMANNPHCSKLFTAHKGRSQQANASSGFGAQRGLFVTIWVSSNYRRFLAPTRALSQASPSVCWGWVCWVAARTPPYLAGEPWSSSDMGSNKPHPIATRAGRTQTEPLSPSGTLIFSNLLKKKSEFQCVCWEIKKHITCSNQSGRVK